jgi:hypothetical protein
MKKNAAVLLLGFSCVSSPVFSASCEEYPYTDGMPPPEVLASGGVKIISTASVSVSNDDISLINAARDEATLEAKAKIAKFLNEVVTTETTSSKATNEVSTIKNDTKDVVTKIVKESITKNGNSAQALMRGIVPLADCYSKGREVRVSVGLKTDTISQAGNLADTLRGSLSSQPTPSSSNLNSAAPTPPAKTSGGLQGSEGFSNTKNLQNF